MVDGGDILLETVGAAGEDPGPVRSWMALRPRLRRSLLGLHITEAEPERRGFHAPDARRRARLVQVGDTFLAGYHAALLDPRPDSLAAALNAQVARGWRSFAFEGAGMGLALQDALFPRLHRRPTRLQAFLAGPARVHRYLILVGAGWTFGRLPRRYGRALTGLDPLLRWLAFDGYGFHQGYFSWRRSIEGHRVPCRLRGYARRAFDQGLGRSLWFVHGMEPARIAAAIGTFPEARRDDLWSGVGLASAFAGGLPDAELFHLRALAGSRAGHAAQGVAFAAAARIESGDSTEWLERACTVFCGVSASALATLTDRIAVDLPGDGGDLALSEPAYEVWRRRTREHLVTDLGRGRQETPP